MAGGMESRLMRERVREQELRNLQGIMELTQPASQSEGQLRQEQMLGYQQQNDMRGATAPFELQQIIQQSQQTQEPDNDTLRLILHSIAQNPGLGGEEVLNEYLKDQGFMARLNPQVQQPVGILQSQGPSPEQLAASAALTQAMQRINQ